ncbi:hypothetical protein BC937DRAFT_93418 [Endogone sp. FLAS-F59071]|nr:hypothetical protein BC937DRAFT_93418 [Endogone sp. FLAS-F59071]|eukprot:RUS14731.1 hypothetical protein BC937DRAFT_93418 [Endogone sp. FLAS-F59071]
MNLGCPSACSPTTEQWTELEKRFRKRRKVLLGIYAGVRSGAISRNWWIILGGDESSGKTDVPQVSGVEAETDGAQNCFPHSSRHALQYADIMDQVPGLFLCRDFTKTCIAIYKKAEHVVVGRYHEN